MGSTSKTSSSVSTSNSSTLSNQVSSEQPITPTYNLSISSATPPQSSNESLIGGMLAPTTVAPSSNIFFILIMLAVFVLILIFIFKVKL